VKPLGIIAGLLLLGGTAFAQSGGPHLAYVYPAGGRTGTTLPVTVGGQFLMTVSNAYVSGPGVTVAVLEHTRPMNQKEFNELRDRLKTLQEKWQDWRKGTGTSVWTTADLAEREQIRAKILKNPPNRTAPPAMVDKVLLRVTIASNAPAGDREIRLATPLGLSQPLRFCIGTLPEVARPAASPANPDLDKYIEKMGGHAAPAGTPKNEAEVTLPAVVNGQIMPGGVDRYRFFAARGKRIVLAVSARQLIPYLADAVPGWFEPVLTVYDADGKELKGAARFHFRPDPVMCLEVPRDGEYTVEIHDSIYRGREDFVYRLALGELPFVTGIFPLGGRAGERTAVKLTGWNLPEKTLTHENGETGVTELTGDFFNAVPFAVDDLPEVPAEKTADSAADAQKVTLPVIINGRIGTPGAAGVFRFGGHAGQAIVAEVYARRLDSPLDSFLRLTDAAGKQLAFNDDYEDKGTGLNTHHADSYLTATLPADGVYFIQVTDTEGNGGPDFAYRLRVSEPRPDFALRVAPSSLSLRPGVSGALTVYALRRDGFTNTITLGLKDAPAGFSLSGAQLATGQTQAQFTVKAPLLPLDRPAAITLEGWAFLNGKRAGHDAVPAEDMMQAFMYRHLVPARELAVAVTGPARPFMRDAFKITSALPVKLLPGGSARVRVNVPAGGFLDRFQVELADAPEGIALSDVQPTANGMELVFAGDPDKLKPGLTGNLICEVSVKNAGAGKRGKGLAGQTRRGPAATLPAIPFVVPGQ